MTAGEWLDDPDRDAAIAWLAGAVEMMVMLESEYADNHRAACILKWARGPDFPRIMRTFDRLRELPAIIILHKTALDNCKEQGPGR